MNIDSIIQISFNLNNFLFLDVWTLQVFPNFVGNFRPFGVSFYQNSYPHFPG